MDKLINPFAVILAIIVILVLIRFFFDLLFYYRVGQIKRELMEKRGYTKQEADKLWEQLGEEGFSDDNHTG